MTNTQQLGYLSPSDLAIENHVVELPCGGLSGKEPTVWTESDLEQYVSYYAKGIAVDRMFGGFIFNGISTGNRHFIHPMFVGFGKPSDQIDWRQWIELLFAPNCNLNALFLVAKRNNRSPLDIWVSIPYPHPTQTNFGIVNGEILNFEKQDDRFIAIAWWIDSFIKRWEHEVALHEILKFRGFLWQRGAIDSIDEELAKRTNAYVKQKGLYSMWLPNFGSYGYARCNELGFHVTAIHPNYYGNAPWDYNWIHTAYKYARFYHTGIQITFGKGLIYSDTHFLDYLNLSLINKSHIDCFFVYQFPNQTIHDIYRDRLIDYKRLYSFIKGTYRITSYPGMKYQ
jgi:hypothetical protein